MAASVGTQYDQAVTRLILEIGPAHELGARLVRRYRAEIPGYAQLSDAVIENDVLPNSVTLVENLLASLQTQQGIPEDLEAYLRDSAVRRFHQGVPIEGLLHSYRLWERTIWDAIQSVVDTHDPEAVAAAFRIAQGIMSYVDRASVAVAQSFFAEVAGMYTDRSLIHGHVLDALLGASKVSPEAQRSVTALADSLQGAHCVVVIRGGGTLGAGTPQMRQVVAMVRDHLKPLKDRLTIGVRSNEIIAIYPIDSETSDQELLRECDALAAEFPRGVVGISRRHDDVQGVARGYGEAAEAAAISDAIERFGRATLFRDVFIDHLGRASEHTTALIEDTLKPLHEYDAEHDAHLVETLAVFYQQGFNLSQSGAELHVHPNTIAYRLRRIKEITGLDPSAPDDLLLLSLGLKLEQLMVGAPAATKSEGGTGA